MIISILGAGAFGTALGKIVTDNGHEVHYFDPQKYPEVSLEQATDCAHAVIIAIPSIFIPDFIASYPANLKNCPTILASKGLTNLDCFKDFLQFSVLSGPAFAEDILSGKPATFTASDPFAMGLMKNNQITIELVDDPLGIILCGSLKNVYAIGSGFQSSSGHDIATYIEHAHNEMADYLEKHGAERKTADLACGIGDLILTCTNDTSRNFRCGQRLQAGESIESILNDLKTVEGYSTAQIIDAEGYPLLSKVQSIIS